MSIRTILVCLPLCQLIACNKSETGPTSPPPTEAEAPSAAPDELGYVAGEAGTQYELHVPDGSKMIYTIPAKPRVTLAFWETGESTLNLSDEEKEEKSAGEPTFYITFPVGSEDCFYFQHWTPEGDLHPNSAIETSYDGTTFEYRQFTTEDCTGSEQNQDGQVKRVTVEPDSDMPPTLLSKIVGVEE